MKGQNIHWAAKHLGVFFPGPFFRGEEVFLSLFRVDQIFIPGPFLRGEEVFLSLLRLDRKCHVVTAQWFSSVQFSHSVVSDSAALWIAACQASLSITNSWSLLKLMSIELVMPSNHLIPLSSPSPPAFNLSQHQGLFKCVSSLHQVAKVGI